MVNRLRGVFLALLLAAVGCEPVCVLHIENRSGEPVTLVVRNQGRIERDVVELPPGASATVDAVPFMSARGVLRVAGRERRVPAFTLPREFLGRTSSGDPELSAQLTSSLTLVFRSSSSGGEPLELSIRTDPP